MVVAPAQCLFVVASVLCCVCPVELPNPARLTSTDGTMAGEMKRIVLFGDSITQGAMDTNIDGWGAQLAHIYQRKYDIVVRGYSGYNTRWAKVMLPRVVPRTEQPTAAFVVFFGANDSAMKGVSNHQDVPVDEFKANLREIAAYAVDTLGVPIANVVIVTPPRVDESVWNEYCLRVHGSPGTRRDANAKEYAIAAKAVADEIGASCADVYTAMEAEPDHTILLSDGLHLSKLGCAIVAKAVSYLSVPCVIGFSAVWRSVRVSVYVCTCERTVSSVRRGE
eukprot:Opistho-2@8293